ncbi:MULTISPECIES: glycosyltransferase family 2 protein [Acidobacterium]|uniref:Bactoprenol glucosyl transferase n=1 Tax=Acidobacterium capsulatum (strain ATCC 51196 / DSM 11244 / BCRC 80197 / JCM 7670 / NBRC 15755 / NCIMB 13165 / 161) TaxID=240015 RepID=C1F1I1_ACIC5|nr:MULTISPECIES: glycosyltransferase family 2 protein [Acidobacterium]ACO34439.1 bactoprenol glucosyl transferase [Acidobacterium capsulatum ATCC 51196]HCT61893.1 glycosyltransferase [Acidobacterium sp.]
MSTKLITIVTPCYNEEQNVRELYRRTSAVMTQLPGYKYQHLFIDNASSDGTVTVLREMASGDPQIKVIVNARNFGHLRSPMHAFLQAEGDIVGILYADLQDPPELFIEMVHEWEKGKLIVAAIKNSSAENGVIYRLRTAYYRLVARLTSVEVMEHFTGFGLYDRKVVDILRQNFHDPYPYFRGMIAEIGLPTAKVYYPQKRRERGITKNNFYTLYDLAMLGITNLSKVPLRLVTFAGFVSALVSFFLGVFYLIYKIIFWSGFSVGIAPLVIGLFFLGSIQMIAMGIIGEYVGAIHTTTLNRPLVVERERINF